MQFNKLIKFSLFHHQIEGGSFKPQNCEEREKLAIIIPYRDRINDLTVLLKYLHPLLQRQQRYYRVFLVEQVTSNVSILIRLNLCFISTLILVWKRHIQ